jgi:nucleotide-binding universal stress UspA family protein
MALRDILVCIDGTAAGDVRLELALNLAQANKAHLTAVYALPEPRESTAAPAAVGLPPMVLGPVSPEGARVMSGQPISAIPPAQALREAERADTIEERFHEELPVRALDGEWHMFGHTDLAELSQLVKSTDLVILGQYPGDDSDGVTWLRPDDLIIDSGRPVLVVPYAGTFERVGRRVLVAWDGTREANRALHDALPLIGGADMIVAGAYHHSQLRERLLGGGQPRSARSHDGTGADVALRSGG